MKKLLIYATVLAVSASFGSALYADPTGQVREYSETWKPGFEYDDGQKTYVRTKVVHGDTSYNHGGKTITKVITSKTPKPGFQNDDNNRGYVKTVTVPNPRADEKVAANLDHDGKRYHEDMNPAPGHMLDDTGKYVGRH